MDGGLLANIADPLLGLASGALYTELRLGSKKVLRWMLQDQTRTLVGGRENRVPVLFDVGVTESGRRLIAAEFGKPPPLVLKGVRNSPVEQRAPGTVASVIE